MIIYYTIIRSNYNLLLAIIYGSYSFLNCNKNYIINNIE